ncbi:hypothetical protein MNBD_GAMMA11-1280 [hydrothermal vent metagenome]|uniref:Site-specific tyrosine recombinase n=1 Tax=hydrothermal vent metagenome TaxID=652676 RepID=A0A3B0X4N2_9ZZZZ
MSELRKAMNDQMLLKGFSERTQKSYLAAVRLLAQHYHLPPDKLSHEDIQNWFLYLLKERHVAPATCRAYLHALRFFYCHVLHWKKLNTGFSIPKKKQQIPDLLSPSDVHLIIENAASLKYRTAFIICYTCGLRLSEVTSLEIAHIHSEEHYLQIVQGKGFKDRNVPLPLSTIQTLREYWQAYRPKRFLFPNRDGYKPISVASIQKSFTQSKSRAGITKNGGIHGLRHAFATHQLRAGMPIHQLKTILGHTDLKTTERYLHWCPQSGEGGRSIDLLQDLLEEKPDE